MNDRRRGFIRLAWATAAVLALLTPAASGTVLDGIPLDGRAEAVLVGMLVPILFVLDRRVFDRLHARLVTGALVAAKAASIGLLTTNGLCTELRTDRPVVGPVEAIRFDEPSGFMRSWDVRAHWGAGTPACSAITRRDYPSRASFPVWFVNLLENTNPPHLALNMRMTGVITTSQRGQLGISTAPALGASLVVDGQPVAADSNRQLATWLDPGSHTISLTARLAGDDWRLVPSWQGGTLWSSVLVTLREPSALDRALWWLLPHVTTILAVMLIGGWLVGAVRRSPLDSASLACVALACLMTVSAVWWVPSLSRIAPLAFTPLLLLPAAGRAGGIRAVTWLVGLPWLALAGALAVQHVGEFARYTRGDDWLVYQIAAHRIYLYGYWLEAGESLFYYQPLYRWIAGALHMVFGDSSAGELYWDAASLLIGALLAFHLTRAHLGARAALAAAMFTLVTFTVTPIWYFIGRGLAEISAAAFGWAAALTLARSGGRFGRALLAGVLGVLAYYTRLNQMLFAGSLVVFLLPPSAPSAALRRPIVVLRSFPWRSVAAYASMLALGLLLLGLRAWIYAGTFTIFGGTSFGLNHTGLALTTLFSAEVWANVGHSLLAQTMVNEAFDVRGLVVLAGSMTAVLAVVQVPRLSRVPLVVALSGIGALLGAFVAHAHGYPGRFSIHLVPLATPAALLAIKAVTGTVPR